MKINNVYEKYKHLDELLSKSPEQWFPNEFVGQILSELWLAVKEMQPPETPKKTCPCCDRAGEYNGLGSGPLAFVCPESCSCHD